MRTTRKVWGEVRFLPGALILTTVLVVMSRVLNLQPGYLYGIIAGLVSAVELSRRAESGIAIGTSFVVLIVAVLAWLAWVPVSLKAAQPGAGIWIIAAEAALGGTFVAGLESVVIGLLPISFMQGDVIRKTSVAEWAAVYGVALFVFVIVLLRPGSDYGVDTTGQNLRTLVAAGGFALFALSFWGYFRLRNRAEA
jgi:hypothetical protein